MSSKKIHCIYGLIDPRNNVIFYIGKTCRPNTRIYGHLAPSNVIKRSNCCTYVRNMLEQGVKPLLKVLLTCKEKNINKFEKHYITKYKKLNPNLTNQRPGGESWNRMVYKPTPRSIAAKAKLRKPVILRNSETLEETEFESCKSAAKFLNVTTPTINAYLKQEKGKRICRGYFIRYKGEEFKEPPKYRPDYGYIKYSLDGILIKEYKNIDEVLQEGYNCSTIYKASNETRPHAYGYKWKRKIN